MSLEEALAALESSITAACERSGRSRRDVQLVAVSKYQPVDKMQRVQHLLAERGEIVTFGENYVQEFQSKREFLAEPYSVHLIGALQRNKVRAAVNLFDLIESVHSLDLVREINSEALRIGKRQAIYLQVNISADPAKKGFSTGDVAGAVELCQSLDGIALQGLMAITQLYSNAEDARGDFRALRSLRDRLGESCGVPIEDLALSMGMSADYGVAIEEGATVVRVGSALFGVRSKL